LTLPARLSPVRRPIAIPEPHPLQPVLAGATVADDRQRASESWRAQMLTVFDWAGYEDPSFHQKFTEKDGDEPSFAFFGDEDEAFEKLRAGFKADLAHRCSQSVVKWREAGSIEPLDTSKIAGWNDMLRGTTEELSRPPEIRRQDAISE
jgi:spermidine/putrescine-binding protein